MFSVAREIRNRWIKRAASLRNRLKKSCSGGAIRYYGKISLRLFMLKAIEGIFRDGKIELLEPPPDQKEARVLVTFLEPAGPIDLQARGISPAEAMEHRARLGAIVEDWDRPEMDVYDEP
jgi:hypothetical protein